MILNRAKWKKVGEGILMWISPFIELFYSFKRGKVIKGYPWKSVEIKPPWILYPYDSPEKVLLENARYITLWLGYWRTLTETEQPSYLKRWKGGGPWSFALEKENPLHGDFPEATELFQAPFVEIKPPWIVYPDHPPEAIFWRQAGEPYYAYSWLPYIQSMSSEQRKNYWIRWDLPVEWIKERKKM